MEPALRDKKTLKKEGILTVSDVAGLRLISKFIISSSKVTRDERIFDINLLSSTFNELARRKLFDELTRTEIFGTSPLGMSVIHKNQPACFQLIDNIIEQKFYDEFSYKFLDDKKYVEWAML